MKKIVIFNDIHSNYFILNGIMKQIDNIDEYIFCGDMITDGFDNNKVLELVKSLTNNVIAGNREISIVEGKLQEWQNSSHWKNMLYAYNQIKKEQIDFLSSLPIYKIIEIEGKKICFSHGSPYHVRDCIMKDDFELFDKLIEDFNCDVYFFAHTHECFYINYKNKMFINSGAVSCSLYGPPCTSTYGILTINNDITYEQKQFSFDFEHIKKYYLSSDYHNKCREWCNLILYMLKNGNTDYCCQFIEYLNQFEKDDSTFEKRFEEFMQIHNLEIL